MSKHTEGPWAVGEDHPSGASIPVRALNFENRKRQAPNVCVIMKSAIFGEDQTRANAAIIAAAPLMYSALKTILADAPEALYYSYAGKLAIEAIQQAETI